MLADNLNFKGACEYLGIEIKPTKKTRREIRRQIRKKELEREFNTWRYERHDELCQLYRTLQKAKDLCKTEADVERIGDFYHNENISLEEMGILIGDDEDAKLDLYREACNG
jgi:hypothetical protein